MRITTSILTTLALLSSTVTAALTGDKYCNTDWCLEGLYDGTDIAYNLTINQGGKQFGWRGIGMGTQMAGANMMVGWVNMDNSVTLSQRSTTAEVMPTTAAVKAAAFQRSPSFSDPGMTSMAWKFPYTATTGLSTVQHIWSINPDTAPATNDPSSTIFKHSTRGFFALDLTKPATAGSVTTSNNSGSSQGTAIRDKSLPAVRVLIAHMVFMTLGWMLLAPLGALIARYGRTFFKWLPVHKYVQYTTYLFVFIGFFLAVGFKTIAKTPHFEYRHEQLGLSLFILLTLQVIMGEVGHRLFRAKGIRVLNYVHMFTGIVIFSLAVWNIHLGFALWRWQPPAYASYIIYAWAGFIFLLYAGGLTLLKKEKRLDDEKKAAVQKTSDSDEQLHGKGSTLA